MQTLNDLVKSGKVRFIGASNYSGWELMSSLAISDRYGYRCARLDTASAVAPPYPYYPYWSGQFAERNAPRVPVYSSEGGRSHDANVA